MLKFKKYDNVNYLNVNKHEYICNYTLINNFKYKTKIIRFVILINSYQLFFYVFSDVFNKDKSNKNIIFHTHVINYFNKTSCNFFTIS